MSLVEIRDYRLAFDTFDGTLHVLDGIDLSLEAVHTRLTLRNERSEGEVGG